MELSRDINDSIRHRALQDAGFREGLLEEGVKRILAGEYDVGEALVNDYIIAIIQLEQQSFGSTKSRSSINRIINSKGNTPVDKLVAAVQYLQEQSDLQLKFTVSKAA